jgi:DNA-binding NarL/FixJ family response regulator
VVRIALITDIRFFADGLPRLIGDEPGLSVVATCTRVDEAVTMLGRLLPDVVLFDSGVSGGPDLAESLREFLPDVRVIVLALRDPGQDALSWFAAGAAGFVTRDDSLADFLSTIRGVARGEVRCSPQVAGALLGHLARKTTYDSSADRLTARETEIVALLQAGLSNKEIALRLCIQLPTVKNHIHRIFEKLHVVRRAQAAAWYRRKSLSTTYA